MHITSIPSGSYAKMEATVGGSIFAEVFVLNYSTFVRTKHNIYIYDKPSNKLVGIHPIHTDVTLQAIYWDIVPKEQADRFL